MIVSVDGDEVGEAVAEGQVVSPPALAPGEHKIEFNFNGESVAATVKVKAGATQDVVVHRPAQVDGEPVVSVYPTSTEPIGPGKARVLIAHTATTAPVDAAVDGQVVFSNIANGEYAEADVAAGRHRVALLPSGVEGQPILGPLDVKLTAGTLTTVYAVGNPRVRSMDVIVRKTPLRREHRKAPTQVETGSAGLVAHLRVLTFRAR